MLHRHILSRRSFVQRVAAGGLALAVAAPLSRIALAQNGDIELVATSDGIRIRDKAGLSSNVLGSVSTGDVVNQIGGPVSADGYDWIQVSVQKNRNLTGWAASQFFQQGGGPSAGSWPAGTDVHVTSDDVNLRTGPGLGNSVIATFDTNTNAGVMGGPQYADGYAWYKIGIGGTSGWMVEAFLAKGHVDDTGAPATFPAGAWVWTTTDVNLRSGAGTGNGIVATYGAHEAATIVSGPTTANGYSWYKVEMADDKKVGYMAGEFLDYAPTEPTGSRLRVVDGPLNLRQGPRTTSTIVTTLATGDVVVIRDASFVVDGGYRWANVYVERNPDLAGWVATEFTKAI